MADDNALDFVLDLDSTQFAQKIIESVDRVEGLGAALGGVAVAAGTVGVAMLAVKTAIDLTFEAETIKAVNAQFDILAQQAGLAGDAIKEGMEKASGGLLSESEQMQLANKAIIDLGASAARIPEIMDLARKVSMVTGQGIAETFQSIEQAVATGQTRQLKNYGIVVDSTKAYRDYAAAIGIGVGELSKAGEIQAIMNQALDQGRQKYQNVQVDVKEATNAWQAFKATMSDVADIAVVAYDKIAGEKVRSSMMFLRDWAQGMKTDFEAHFGEGAAKAAAQATELKDKIKDLTVQIIDLEQEQQKAPAFKAGLYASEIASAKEQLKSYQDQLAQTNATKEKSGDKFIGPIQPAGDRAAASSKDPEKAKVAAAQHERDMLALKQAALDQRKQMIVMEAEDEKKINEQADKFISDQEALIKEQTRQKIDEIKNKHLNPKAEAEEIRAAEQQKTQALILAEQQRAAIRQQAADNINKLDQNSASGFARAWESGSRSAQLQLSNWNAFGQRTFKSFEGNATSALVAFGAGQKSASDAAKAFIFGMLADEAEARGKIMLLASIWPPNPAGLAAGAGLIALSGFLRSQGGGGGSSSGSVDSGSSSGGGGSAGNFSSGSAPLQQQTTPKAVTIQIQGSYFETEQTKQRLVEMIRESSDATDFKIT